MARSVRHCKASPSGSRIGIFCRLTKSARIVSKRGLRDLRQQGQRNFVSGGTEVLPLTAILGRGTQWAIKGK